MAGERGQACRLAMKRRAERTVEALVERLLNRGPELLGSDE